MAFEQNMKPFPRNNSSSSKNSKQLIPFMRSKSTPTPDNFEESSNKPLVAPRSPAALQWLTKPRTKRFVSTLVRRLLSIITVPTSLPKFKNLITKPPHLSIIPSAGRMVSGTLFGKRRGHVSFAVQNDNRVKPVLLLELDISTAALAEDMSTGTGRIVLECQKSSSPVNGRPAKLFSEPKWSMYCKGRQCGYARSRACTESDWRVLSAIRSVSVGAGVIPVAAVEDGGGDMGGASELVYMRATFERVVGSRDSEAFYMMNPDGSEGPELSIFLLRK